MTRITGASEGATAARSLYDRMDTVGRQNYDKERSGGQKDRLTWAVKSCLKEAAGKAGGLPLLPAISVYGLLSGLNEIGKAHVEPQQAGEAKATRRGYAETLGQALDRPGATAGELLQLAAKSAHVSHFGGLARANGVAIEQKNRQKFESLSTRYMEGAQRAVNSLEKLSPQDRQKLARLLEARLDGGSTADRIYDLLTYGGPR